MKQARLRLGWTQDELSRKIREHTGTSISISTIKQYEEGIKPPSQQTIRLVSQAFVNFPATEFSTINKNIHEKELLPRIFYGRNLQQELKADGPAPHIISFTFSERNTTGLLDNRAETNPPQSPVLSLNTLRYQNQNPPSLGPFSKKVFQILSKHTWLPWAIMQTQCQRLGKDSINLKRDDLEDLASVLSESVARFSEPGKQAMIRAEICCLIQE